MTKYLAAMLLVAALAAIAQPAGAQELSGPCPVGKMVSDRQGNTGMVVDTDPVGCHVSQPDGSKKYYLSWMLHLAGNPVHAASEIAAIAPGRYTCWGSGHYLFMDINIKSGTSYTDVKGAPGNYSYDARTQMITFTSGTFKGSYAKFLGKEGIGLASQPSSFFATLCDLEK